MKKLLIFTPFVILFRFISCQKDKDTAETEALLTLREADKAWSQSAPDLDLFMSFIADDVVWFIPDGTKKFGKNDVRSYLESIFKLPSFSLTWSPNGFDVSETGDMGYVYGLYKWSHLNSSGNPVEYTNRSYTTFWKKQSGGDWKVVLEADY